LNETITIVKIGGNIINDESRLDSFLEKFSKISGPKILVHGGGKIADQMLEKLGVKAEMVDGRRITDSQTLDVITGVYAGKINKSIVSKLNGLGENSLGLTGADANLIRSKKRSGWKVDYGFVGDVESVNSALLISLLGLDLSLIFAPITQDLNGQLLNTNADTIASALASGVVSQLNGSGDDSKPVDRIKNVRNVKLIYCFELPGVMTDISDKTSVLPVLSEQKYKEMKTEGQISSGMIPKLDNCFMACKNQVGSFGAVGSVVIGQAEDLDKLVREDHCAGTLIKGSKNDREAI